ncbi:hypothetical protein Tco_0654708 [Tanacetum coccineum]|uniref:Uncharacterized protein n=1 Tax=Tanacetum coccineum TaxID=301880 RepID=A0ABQ4X3Z3_9ASTR
MLCPISNKASSSNIISVRYQIGLTVETYLIQAALSINQQLIPNTPTPNLSFTGLDEFVNKPVVENKKSNEEVSKVVRKSDDSLIIKDWVSDSEEENVSQPKTEKKTIKPSIAKIEFVKPKQQEKTQENVKQIQVSDGLGPQKKLIFLSDVQSNPQLDLQDKGVIDSGCSRQMTGNMSYLTDYEEIDGGYVAFGGNPKRGYGLCFLGFWTNILQKKQRKMLD